MFTRRRFIKIGAMAGSALLLPTKWMRRAWASIPGGSLPPEGIPKFVQPLVIPPAMPRVGKLPVPMSKAINYYEIAVRQFQQQILPPPSAVFSGLPKTTVWSYGAAGLPGTVFEGGSFHYPALTIESRWKAPTRVKWINGLVDANGNYLPHLLPVDQTLHWANPPGGQMGRDMRPEFESTPGPYLGPVPIVTHVHGAHVPDWGDGYAEAWFLPNAAGIPGDYARVGTWYDVFKGTAETVLGQAWDPGTAVFQYPNDQRATTLWYHDHTLGMTRLNVYAGPAGFYILRGGPDDEVLDRRGRAATLPGPAPGLGDPAGMAYYEIPIAIQDRSFNTDGSLFYPDSRAFFEEHPEELPGFIPDTDLSPIWNPEFFGNMMVVNGRTWPFLNVEQRRYRFRFLNGCNSRFLILQLDRAGLNFWQIGAEGGYLPAAVELEQLLMSPAERADVIVDFTNIPVGTSINLQNIGPDEPFGGGVPGEDFEIADPLTTGLVMQFRVVRATSRDASTPIGELALPPRVALGPASLVRPLSLNELVSEYFDGPAEAQLGGLGPNGEGVPLAWMEAVTENPALGATEVWELHNFTEDAHPIHIHQVMFEVVNREGEDGVRPPEAWETGVKDTVIAYPEEVTRVKARFDIPGRFVWHCHIVEHEDNEMMRPYQVVPTTP